MAADLTTVMDQIGVALATIDGLRSFDFPPKSATPPFAFPAMPQSVDYDLTYGRGADRMSVKVFLGLADVIDRATRDALAGYAAGSGASSVKAAIESASIGSSVRVIKAEFGTFPLNGVTYAGAIFTLDIAA